MFTYAHRYIVVVIANGMADIASGAPQHIATWMEICGMMWKVK
jgi:hypothetical protein